MIELRFRFDAALRELVQPGPGRVTARRPYLLMTWLEMWVRLADEKVPPCRVYKVNHLGLRPTEVEVSASVLYMSMSLDGYIAGPNDEPGNPGGDRFDRLHEWYGFPDGEFARPSGLAGQFMDEVNVAGAVLVGRRTAE